MGNADSIPSCGCLNPSSRRAEVILPDGTTRRRKAPRAAAEILAEFPEHFLCHADSFFLNHNLPSLSLGDRLLAGETYILVPTEKFPSPMLSSATIAALSSPGGERKRAVRLGKAPFECVKDAGGKTGIRLSREFLVRILTGGEEGGEVDGGLCSTPELRRHYEQLVGSSKVQPWSPRLDPIAEAKGPPEYFLHLSPSKLVGLLRAS